jgi:tetratricopeptide (TPR) repeat protein
MKQELLGASHPSIANSMYNLAELYCSQGRYEEAEPLYVKALELAEVSLGKEHPNTKMCRNNLQSLHDLLNITSKSILTIYDKQGRDYQIEVNEHESILLLKVYRSLHGLRNMVGHIKCIFKSHNEMLLADIHFEDKIDRNPLKRIYAFFHQEPKSYRKLGLGTATLKFLIKYVKEKGIKKIHGSITQDDLDANPNLVKWYRDNGFTVEDLTAQKIQNRVASICLYPQNQGKN